jgi:LacI family transcriptional regulator
MEDKKKDVTIYDLALELNVSPSTVSRALNDHFSIGKKTKKAVQELAREWGYRPNTLASSLRTNRSNTIGVIASWINRPFISSLISGIENAAREAGYKVIITQSHDQLEIEKDNLEALYDSRVSGLIASLAMETSDYDHFKSFLENDIPVVFVDRIPNLDNVNKVNINNFHAGFQATQHLIEQGCKRIAHFGGARNQKIYEDRFLGYREALKKYKIKYDPNLVKEASNLSAEEGKRFIEEVWMLEDRPDGIFCANDTSAVSAIGWCKKNGVKVPNDIAIIGFNNDPICEIIDPPLSSIHHPAQDMGEAALNQVLQILNNNRSNGTTIFTLETHVVARASSKRK